ncbi:MAG: peptide chain release factor N(5)-glutamine methyltransferase [Nitrosomonas sp.]|nr:peptide chain release factor N(5)-glutamine methyltransferase [Nitrosomonas sp.]
MTPCKGLGKCVYCCLRAPVDSLHCLEIHTLKQQELDQEKSDVCPGTISRALAWACRRIDTIDARMLLQHVLCVNHAFLLTHLEEPVPASLVEKFTTLVLQRVSGMPVAYLTGERAFYDQIFKVTPAVLVPRPETELLVDLVLETIAANGSCSVLDLGTGSGAIAITIARHRPQANVVAVDLSNDAISVARWNAQNLGVDNVCLIQGNWYAPLGEDKKFDVIVSNPPYVAECDPHLQQGDLRFEPAIALSAGENGLACIRHIIAAAPAYLVDGGRLLIEHGYDQSAICRLLMEHVGFMHIEVHKDLAGIERVCDGRYFM